MNAPSFATLLLAALLAAPAPSHRAPARHHATPPAHAMRILCLGDSYTAGEGVPAADGWPAQLTTRLRARGLACAAPRLVARTGWSTGELAAAIDAADLGGPYDLVTLAVGVNDQYRGRSLDIFRAEFSMLLARATELAGGDASRVVVLAVPDWGVTPYGRDRDPDGEHIANAIDSYNAALLERVQLVGARWVDVTVLSRRHGAEPRFLAADGLHPSGAAYRDWAEAVADTLRNLTPRR